MSPRILLPLLFVPLVPRLAVGAEWRFELSFAEAVRETPFTGRVYVFFSRSRPEPRTGPGWFRPEAFVAKEVTDWKPGSTVELRSDDETVLSFPKPFSEMDLSGMRAQAVARFDTWSRTIGTGPGNGYGPVVELKPPFEATTARLTIDQVVEPPGFEETERRKLFAVKSKSLSEFHGRDVTINAAVHLPEGYGDDPERRYPVAFYVPGFGGTHHTRPYLPANDGQPFIDVVLDPSCPLGHHVFADSANNGPWGTALVDEWLPAFDREFRTVAKPSARFLTGHSSGGWATLWMQVAHPDVFGGTWSTAPDPVDFRDFQQIDLYADGERMYVDGEGERRPLARSNGRVLLWYDDFDRMETVLGPGGQLHSFEAVFSPRGEDGRPLRAWNRRTGEVDTSVTKHWEKYDIRLVLDRGWETLGPKLAGKLNVVMGDEDTFYLDGATRLLREAMQGRDATIEMVPGRDHSNVLDQKLRTRIRSEMTAAYHESRSESDPGDGQGDDR